MIFCYDQRTSRYIAQLFMPALQDDNGVIRRNKLLNAIYESIIVAIVLFVLIGRGTKASDTSESAKA